MFILPLVIFSLFLGYNSGLICLSAMQDERELKELNKTFYSKYPLLVK